MKGIYMKKLFFAGFVMMGVLFGKGINICESEINVNYNNLNEYMNAVCVNGKLYLLFTQGYGKYKTGYTIPIKKNCKCIVKIQKGFFGKNKINEIKILN